MIEEINQAGADAATSTDGDGASTEDLNNYEGDTQSGQADNGKDWQKMYEDQKTRAEKAEAAAKAAREGSSYDPETIRKEAEAAAQRTYEQQYLNEQGFPDEIKSEIETLAQLKGISLREAAQHGYIQTQVEDYKRQQKVAQASPDTGNGGTASYTFDPDNPPDVDVSTTEGQEAIEKWEQELERRRSK